MLIHLYKRHALLGYPQKVGTRHVDELRDAVSAALDHFPDYLGRSAAEVSDRTILWFARPGACIGIGVDLIPDRATVQPRKPKLPKGAAILAVPDLPEPSF